MRRRGVSGGGLAVGVLFALVSVSPTQMPRTFVAQGAITGSCLAIGYSLGVLGVVIARALLRRTDLLGSDADRGLRAWARLLIGVALVSVVVMGLVAWPRWQDQQRRLLAMEPVPAWWPLPMLVVVLVGSLVLRDVLGSWFVARVQTAFGTVDVSTSDGVELPLVSSVSGSPDSLAAWDTLGRQGRDFVAGVTARDDIVAFRGDRVDALDPIRVYAGLRTAESAVERSAIVVAELERTAGWEREVLVVTTVTGTGWVDPDAARAIEMLHGGDTAIVAIQYSYLPSWISTFVDDGRSSEAGRELFDAVHAAWSRRPADDRPTLVVFGQSLGSYGAEAAFTGSDVDESIAALVDRTEGALFTGPTNDNELWAQLVGARDPSSPPCGGRSSTAGATSGSSPPPTISPRSIPTGARRASCTSNTPRTR